MMTQARVYRRSVYRLVFILLATIACLAWPVSGQFGVPKPKTAAEQEISNAGDATETDGQTGVLSPQDAADMEQIIMAAKDDPQTIEVISRMKGDMSHELNELRKLSEEEIMGGMKGALEDLKSLDYLFKDKDKALAAMIEDGMIEKAHIKKYKKNPELLEEDTRKGIASPKIAPPQNFLLNEECEC
eukprot:scaffold160666_cov44-Attheya_sp.AAC.1